MSVDKISRRIIKFFLALSRSGGQCWDQIAKKKIARIHLDKDKEDKIHFYLYIDEYYIKF